VNEPRLVPAGSSPEGVAQILALAFHDDPLTAWMAPDVVQRPRKLAAMVESLLRHHYLRTGEVWVADGGAAALWAPPGAPEPPDQMGFEMAELFGEDVLRLGELFRELGERHPSVPHWYLGMLGAVPERQGHGLGSALLRTVLDRADAAGEPAYLEATSPRSRRLYERHGFELMEEFAGPGGAPPLWLMWRG
jgi:GNAT superfamily N-acetyltransferase